MNTDTPGRPNGFTNLGFVGAGNMGSPMVSHLLAAGFNVAISDIAPRHYHGSLLAEGAEWSETVQALARESQVVLTCLPSSDVTGDVFLSPDGLLAAAGPGTIFIDHGVTHPELSVAIADRAAAKGAIFLDCPVSGGPDGARSGRLAAMFGGPPEAVQAVTPVVSTYCHSVVHVGGVGKGQELKLINQMLVAGYTAIIAEAWDATCAAGIDPQAALKALNSGWGHSTLLERHFNVAITGRFEDTGATIGAFMHGFDELFDYVSAWGLQAPLTNALRAIFIDAVQRGLSDQDLAALARMRP
jgi:3-hydroxyisobutyrate dehydrogenase